MKSKNSKKIKINNITQREKLIVDVTIEIINSLNEFLYDIEILKKSVEKLSSRIDRSETSAIGVLRDIQQDISKAIEKD